jgi:hypothetical protein
MPVYAPLLVPAFVQGARRSDCPSGLRNDKEVGPPPALCHSNSNTQEQASSLCVTD